MAAIRAHAIAGLISSPDVNQYKVMVVNRFIYALATLLPKMLSGGRLLRVKPARSFVKFRLNGFLKYRFALATLLWQSR